MFKILTAKNACTRRPKISVFIISNTVSTYIHIYTYISCCLHCTPMMLLLVGRKNVHLVFFYHVCCRRYWQIIIIIMVIFKCYFSGEHIALSIKKQQQRCEHGIRISYCIDSLTDSQY